MAAGCGWTWRTMRARSRRADRRTGRKGHGRLGGWGRKRHGQSSGCADGTHEARRGGRAEEARTGPRRRRRGPAGGRADKRPGGRADWAVGAEEPRSGGLDGQVDERVGLGLKGHIPRGPFHSWMPSPLALSERECVGCLGV